MLSQVMCDREADCFEEGAEDEASCEQIVYNGLECATAIDVRSSFDQCVVDVLRVSCELDSTGHLATPGPCVRVIVHPE
jgi:hypothetical protein